MALAAAAVAWAAEVVVKAAEAEAGAAKAAAGAKAGATAVVAERQPAGCQPRPSRRRSQGRRLTQAAGEWAGAVTAAAG